MFIDDERKWRISKSGYSIRTGWANDKQIIAKYAGEIGNPEDFKRWFANAELICSLYNAQLSDKVGSVNSQQG